jgi:hypothetical protein
MYYDAQTVLDAAGPLDRFAVLSCDVLLLDRARNTRNLTAALDGLSAVLSRARRVTPPRTGHTAPDNNGKPELVAAQLQPEGCPLNSAAPTRQDQGAGRVLKVAGSLQ